MDHNWSCWYDGPKRNPLDATSKTSERRNDMNTPETAMFGTHEQESRVHHRTAEATCDRLVLMSIYPMLKMYMRKMRTRNITLADGGCVEDLEALVELFKPHSRGVV